MYRRTDGRPDDGKDARSILLSRVKMISKTLKSTIKIKFVIFSVKQLIELGFVVTEFVSIEIIYSIS